MKNIWMIAAVAALLPLGLQASPKEDVDTYRTYFTEKFPQAKIEDYVDGVYAIDPVRRQNWEAIEEFPPYEPMIEDGQAMFETAFKNGKGYADCFDNGGIGIAQQFPYWDKNSGEVVTLPLTINRCREANGEKPLKYKKGKIASLLAYMRYTSRGKVIDVKVPSDDPRALAAYEEGKTFYFARRGQLNFSCANCHFQNAGQMLRADRLSPALGHVTHFPVYRSKWGELGTLHRRFTGCNKQVRAKPFKAQGKEYRNLEYFLTHMSNGLEMNGPGARQ